MSVSSLTQVQWPGKCWLEWPASYLNIGDRDVAVVHLPEIEVDGSIEVEKGRETSSFLESTIKVATWILSLGILPLLALVLNAVFRCAYEFHWTVSYSQQGLIDKLQALPDGVELLPYMETLVGIEMAAMQNSIVLGNVSRVIARINSVPLPVLFDHFQISSSKFKRPELIVREVYKPIAQPLEKAAAPLLNNRIKCLG